MSGEMKYVLACYLITWLGLAAYTFAIIRRIKRAEQDLEGR